MYQGLLYEFWDGPGKVYYSGLFPYSGLRFTYKQVSLSTAHSCSSDCGFHANSNIVAYTIPSEAVLNLFSFFRQYFCSFTAVT